MVKVIDANFSTGMNKLVVGQYDSHVDDSFFLIVEKG
jgi:hypothetical protein